MLGFFFVFNSILLSQEVSSIDSLETAYITRKYIKSDQLSILKELSYNHPDPDKALKYSEELIQSSMAIDSIDYLLNGYLNKGNALKLKGDLSTALESYFKGAKIAMDKIRMQI